MSACTSRSTTTAYRPSLPPKCSYTMGFDTLAVAAISSTLTASKPLAANSDRPISISCSRRWYDVILDVLAILPSFSRPVDSPLTVRSSRIVSFCGIEHVCHIDNAPLWL